MGLIQIKGSSSNVVYLKHRTDSYIKDFRPNVTKKDKHFMRQKKLQPLEYNVS